MQEKKELYIWEAEPEQKGAFSDVKSHNTYQNGNLTDAVEAETKALLQGTPVTWLDAPVLESDPYNVEPGQQFNHVVLSRDSQGVEYQSK
jgi:hypothetical protein